MFRKRHAELEHAVLRHPYVLACCTTAAQAACLLHVLIADVGMLDALLRTEIAQMLDVERTSTTLGLKTIKRRSLVMPRLREG